MFSIVLRFSSAEVERKDALASEIDGWVQLAQEKYTEVAIASEIRTLSQLFTHELLDLCKSMARAKKLNLTRLCLTTFASKSTLQGIKSPSADVMR